MEDFALELAEPIGFGDCVGTLETGVQKPYLGAFGDVIVAAFLNLGETVVEDDQEKKGLRVLITAIIGIFSEACRAIRPVN